MWHVPSCARQNETKTCYQVIRHHFLNCTVFYISLFYYLKSSVTLTSALFLRPLAFSVFKIPFFLTLIVDHCFPINTISFAQSTTLKSSCLAPSGHLVRKTNTKPNKTKKKKQYHAARINLSSFPFTRCLSSHL